MVTAPVAAKDAVGQYILPGDTVGLLCSNRSRSLVVVRTIQSILADGRIELHSLPGALGRSLVQPHNLVRLCACNT